MDNEIKYLNEARPFVKWAGGKSQIINVLTQNLPQELHDGQINTYCEPFVGSGALFFELMLKFSFRKIVLNDSNKALMMAYDVIKNKSDDLISFLLPLERSYLALATDDRKVRYYEIRNKYNELLQKRTTNEVEQTGLFLFLNKTCFNGLYRVNSKGLFNVPVGSYLNPTIVDVFNLRNVSEVLQNVTIQSEPFEKVCKTLTPDTFVYFDPPYRPLSATSAFTAYNSIPFDDAMQLKLGRIYEKLAKNGAKVLLSNSDPRNVNPADNFFDDLYKGFNIQRITAKRAINSKASKRGSISEILVSNY